MHLWSKFTNTDNAVVYVTADELLAEKERYKNISDDLDATFAELAGYWEAESL